MNGQSRAVFLDKDGTLVENVPYNVDARRLWLTAGSVNALRLLRDAGFELFVVSNQSGVARGYFEEAELRAAHDALKDLLAEEEIPIIGHLLLPPSPGGNSPRLLPRLPVS